jgi:molybdopterin molybdotransferase
MVKNTGGRPRTYGIVADSFDELSGALSRAAADCDMVLISGGSSVGVRDFTIEALSSLPDCRILVHGISISPGKPTILAMAAGKALWGLPGHITSAMVVFQVIVQPFIEHAAGLARPSAVRRLPARLSRNLASAQGRVDYVRVRLTEKDGELRAEPLLGKSGLINTLVRADGLVEIGMNAEGLDRDSLVMVRPV